MKKIVSLLLALMFLAFAYVNLNDPDAPVWVAAYAAAAVLFALAFLGRGDRRVTGALAVILFLWMCTMYGGMMDWYHAGFPTIVDEMQASSPHIEVVREFLGLLITVLALAGLYLSTPKAARLSRP